MLWNYQPPPIKPRDGEPLWTMTKGAKTLTCELRYQGEYGVETLVLRTESSTWVGVFRQVRWRWTKRWSSTRNASRTVG